MATPSQHTAFQGPVGPGRHPAFQFSAFQIGVTAPPLISMRDGKRRGETDDTLTPAEAHYVKHKLQELKDRQAERETQPVEIPAELVLEWQPAEVVDPSRDADIAALIHQAVINAQKALDELKARADDEDDIEALMLLLGDGQ